MTNFLTTGIISCDMKTDKNQKVGLREFKILTIDMKIPIIFSLILLSYFAHGQRVQGKNIYLHFYYGFDNGKFLFLINNDTLFNEILSKERHLYDVIEIINVESGMFYRVMNITDSLNNRSALYDSLSVSKSIDVKNINLTLVYAGYTVQKTFDVSELDVIYIDYYRKEECIGMRRREY